MVRPILGEVAALLRAHPEIQQLEIAGFTSSDEPHVKQLSAERARAVMDVLVAASVEPTRLVANGYGPERLAYPNDTRDNRERNRRVEFFILRRAACPAPAQIR